MIRTISLVSVTTLLAAIAASQPAMARGIKDYMSDSELASYCASAGIGTHTQTSVTLKDNSVVTGTVHCEAEDLIVGNDDINDPIDDSDDRLDDDSDDDFDDAFDDSDGRNDDDRDDDRDDDNSNDDDSDDRDDNDHDNGRDRDGDDD